MSQFVSLNVDPNEMHDVLIPIGNTILEAEMFLP